MELLGKDWNPIIEKVRKGRTSEIKAAVLRQFFRLKEHNGVKVVEEDWDYLILLDACRYDYFKAYNNLEGELEKKISRGSTSIEFLNRNFTSYYDDIVYVSANSFVNPYELQEPNYSRKPFDSSQHFHEVVPAYDEGSGITDTPEYVTKKAFGADKEYPNKRKIIHYMQPHAPFIGDYSPTGDKAKYEELLDRGFNWNQIRKAYRSNLKRVLASVEELVDELEGKIVISADHGELLGEYGGMNDHPHGVYLKELVEVPWFVIEKEERPIIKKENKLEDIDI